jgi:hypothetical protein
MRVTFALVLVALALLAGCASAPVFSLPMTTLDFARDSSGPGLIAYLGQRDATADVCNARSTGPHLARFDEPVRAALTAALLDGRVDPTLWRRCAKAFLRTAPRDASASLMDAIGKGYRRLLTADGLETSPELQARLGAMQRLYLRRDHGLDGHAAELDPLFDDLRRAVAGRRLGPVASRFADELLVAVDLERGTFEGRPVDVATIERLHASEGETALRLFSERLPRADLRDEARRRVIRLHIAKSPYPEVRAASAAVETVLMQTGIDALSLTEHAPSGARIDGDKVAALRVLVRQNIHEQSAKLLRVGEGASGASVVPEIPLRGALLVDVAGISRPVTLCASARKLDPSPCILPADVRIEQRGAYVDPGGAVRFVDSLSMRDALDLAAGGEALSLPIRVGGSAAATLTWPLAFERPDDLLFTGFLPGSRGPRVSVLVDRRDSKRFVFIAQQAHVSYLAVVEARDVDAFHVVSSGARGEAGGAGVSGGSGAAGGTCESGGKGGDGTGGGDGGKGGDGGDIVARVACGAAACPGAAQLFSRIIVSRGGLGGSGGSGGKGGPGGSGGSAGTDTVTTDANGHTTTIHGCSAGSNGSAGSDGSSGAEGSPGKPGKVTIVVDP